LSVEARADVAVPTVNVPLESVRLGVTDPATGQLIPLIVTVPVVVTAAVAGDVLMHT
jgi:hypothetical protein